jgi:hypothetical protein
MVHAPDEVDDEVQPLPGSHPSPSPYIRLLAMSVQLRINGLQDRRPSIKTNSRQILRSVDVPESPGALGPACEALEPSGRPCKVALATTAIDPWCHRHHNEWLDINTRWSKTQKEAEKVVVVSSETAKQKVLKLRLSVELRRQIRDRFYPRGGDIQDYIKWIAKLETDVRQLADSLLSMTYSAPQFESGLTLNTVENMNRGPTPETPAVGTPHPDSFNLEKIMILQSPLDPKIPIDSLRGLADDGKSTVLGTLANCPDVSRSNLGLEALLPRLVRRQHPSSV